MLKYTPPPTHKKPDDVAEFLASLSENERLLHQMAERILGSSYFMDRTHGYQKWKKAKANA
jgi:hypothetical protein